MPESTLWHFRAAHLFVWIGFLGVLFAGLPASGRFRRTVPPLRPEVRIPVEPLGYEPPGALPALNNFALVELRYIDATHILFVFNQHGLIRPDHSCQLPDTEQRMMRAVVLEVPSGKVERQASWALYDLGGFLWSLHDGTFLVRRCTTLDRVGSSLALKPWIAGAEKIQSVILSPDRSLMILEEGSSPSTTQAAPHAAAHPASPFALRPDNPLEPFSVQFIALQPLRVFARARLQTPGYIPLMDSGFLEELPAAHSRWMFMLHSFSGQPREITKMTSYCRPQLTPLASQIFVAMSCPNPQALEYNAYNLQGGHLWRLPFDQDRLLPHYLLTRDGAHFAVETLEMAAPHVALNPLTKEDVRGQILEIFDTATGQNIGQMEMAPIYTGGRNADFSPDGTRIAVLRDGAIEIYRLNDLGPH